MLELKSKRIFSLDVIRCFAIIFVIILHFLLNMGNFFKDDIDSIVWYIPFLIRALVFTGVPLFLMLSGYLLNQRLANKKFYKKLFYILGIYLIASVFTALGNVFILNEPFKFWKAFNKILEFEYFPYSWYVEMYVGLFLMIPFLNVLWNNLKNKKQKEYLIVTLFFISIACTICRNPQVLPDYWISMYPITFYFVGAWFSEYEISWTLKKSAYSLLSCVLIFSGLNFAMCYHHSVHKLNSLADQSGIESIITAVLVFNFLIKVNYSRLSEKIKKVISFIAKYSYGLYLCSYITDKVVYGYFNRLVTGGMADKLPYYLVVTTIVFVISLALSVLAEKIYHIAVVLFAQNKS